MDHIALIPHFGAGRGRLARSGHAVVYSVADPVASASFASWAGLVGDRPAGAALDDLARLVGRSGVSAVAAFVSDADGIEVLTYGGAPITVDGRPLSSDGALQRQRLEGASTIELLATGTLADDPLLDFEQGVVAADGFSLRRSAAGPTPWSSAPARAAAAPAMTAEAPAGMAETPAPAMAADAPAMTADAAAPAMTDDPAAAAMAAGAPAMAAHADAPAMAADAAAPAMAAAAPAMAAPAMEAPAMGAPAMGTPADIVSLTGDVDDLPDAQPLPVAGGPAPEPAPAPAPQQAPEPTPAPAMSADQGHAGHDHAEPAAADQVTVHGLVCARGHFNDPRARFCAVCGIAMHQASFVLSEGVRPSLGSITFADGTLYSISANLVFGRDPDDDPAIRAGSALPAVLHDPANTISRVHAEIRAVEWDVYLVDRGSTNGTFVWNPAIQQWDRLLPDQPRIIEPGAQISFGRLVAQYESNLRP